jgi:hypothetical protein
MRGGLRGVSRRGRRSYKWLAPHSVRCGVVCGGFRDGGVAPTKLLHLDLVHAFRLVGGNSLLKLPPVKKNGPRITP